MKLIEIHRQEYNLDGIKEDIVNSATIERKAFGKLFTKFKKQGTTIFRPKKNETSFYRVIKNRFRILCEMNCSAHEIVVAKE